jgi:hypothetical protein
MFEYGIRNLLIKENIISEDNIIDENKFRSFLFGLFLYYFAYERYKWFFNKTVADQMLSFSKGKRVAFSPPSCPFRFVGINQKTIFIGDMGQAHLFFRETLQKRFIESYPTIHYISSRINDKKFLWKNHSCETNCEKCLEDFSKFSLDNFEAVRNIIGINSYILLDIHSSLFEGLISEEDFIEIGQDVHVCSKCNEKLFKHYKYCPGCTEKVDKSIFIENKKPGNPEKIFNECMAIFLSLKKGYSWKANHELDSLFNDEMDIFLSKEQFIKIIEGTVKMELDQEYIIDKSKTLVLVENQLEVEFSKLGKKPPICEIYIWCINNPTKIAPLEEIPKKLFGESQKIFVLPSGINLDNSNRLHLPQTELIKLSSGFDKIIQGILEKI